MKTEYLSKKALSPLLSTVLLISIAVIVASMLMSWSSTMTKTQQKEISNKTGEALSCTSGNADIKDVYIDFTSNISRVHVQNTGLTGLRIISAQLLNNKGESANLTSSSVLPMSFPQGERKVLVFNISGVINSCANFSKAAVSTNCPFPMEYDSAPKCVT